VNVKSEIVEDEFRTKSFPVYSGTRVKYTAMDSKSGYNQMSSNPDLRFEVREAHSGHLLGTLGSLLPNSLQNGKRVADVNLNMSSYAGHTVYLRLSLLGIDSMLRLHAHDIWSANPVSSVNAPKLYSRSDKDAGMSMTGERISLESNYPNPFRSSTTVEFTLPSPGQVRLEVYNVLGRRVATLVDGQLAAGRHALRLDAAELPAGMYSCRLITHGQVYTRTMMLSK
jgi:hypothetical protein